MEAEIFWFILRGIAMRRVLCTAFVIGIASVSTALASPIAANLSVPANAVSRQDVISARPEASETSAQTSLQAQSESRTDRRERQILSKNFQRPKPVQIYWFFGGR